VTGVEDRVRELTGFGADELLALEGYPDGSDAVVYLSGSIVAGHANPWSDIDVFAITDRAPTSETQGHATTNATASHIISGRRVDYEFWRPASVEWLSRRLRAHELGSGKPIAGASFIQIEEIFMHRLRIGIPLLHPEGFAALQEMFDFGLLAAFQAEEAIRHLDAELEDLIGMRKGGDRDTALWVARQVVDVSVEAYIHSRGVTDPVKKWKIKHLEALGGDPHHRGMREDYWRLMYPADAAALRDGTDAWERYAEEVLEFSNRLVAWAQG
jgi:nucleotidyltransferase-like protein